MQSNPSSLNPEQRAAVLHIGGPLLIAAGAGSGKTHTLTSRIRSLLDRGVPAARILAITFTNKAAEEMKRRVIYDSRFKIHELFIGTFHSFGAKLLREEARRLGRTPGFTIFDDDDSFSLLKTVVKNYNLPKEDYAPPIIRRMISDIKNELVLVADIPSHAGSLDPATFAALYEDYEQALRESNAFDFDDLIQKPVQLMRAHPDFLRAAQERFDHILVDEYQDINTAQYALVRALAAGHHNITVVGDDAQSIYAFRGADFRNFLNFERDWASARVILLEENYRSTPVILAAANSIIKHNTLQKQKRLWTKNPAGGLINVYSAEDEHDEAEWVVKQVIAAARSGARLEDIALLYRTNAQSRALEQTLIAAGLPYRIFGGIRFYDRKEIKDILAFLRLAANPADAVSAERLRKNFSKSKAAALISSLPHGGTAKTIREHIDYFLETTNYIEYLTNNYQNFEERLENIQGLIAFADECDPHNLTGFLEQATLAQSHDTPQGKGGVNLMTIHLAKGLEFPTVFVAGVSEGTLPHHRSYESRDGIEEERRLMYVAVTRAGKNLSLSFTNIPSRFLREIDGDLTQFVNLKQGNRRAALLDEDEMWLEYD